MKTDALATLLPATKLAPILKRHMPAEVPAAPLDPIATLVSSFLLWESSTTAAEQALVRVKAECVDFNELRVCLPEEIMAMLGSRYPFAEERANRMRRSLNDIYRREHKVSLDHVAGLGKREQRAYIENLDGMVPFVAGRLLLLHFGQAGVPIDDQLAELFREQKLIAKETTTTDLGHALNKHYHALDEATKVHIALVAFADAAWEKDPKAMTKNKSARMAAQQAAERAARREAEKAAEAAAKAAEAAARAEAERIEAAKVAARAQARADARARAAAAKVADQQAAAAAAKLKAQAAGAAAKGAKPAEKPADRGALKGGVKVATKSAPSVKVLVKGPAKPLAKGTGASSAAPKKPAAPASSKTPAKVAPKPPVKAAMKPATKPATKTAAKTAAKSPAKPVAKAGTKSPAKKPAAKAPAKGPVKKGSKK